MHLWRSSHQKKTKKEKKDFKMLPYREHENEIAIIIIITNEQRRTRKKEPKK